MMRLAKIHHMIVDHIPETVHISMKHDHSSVGETNQDASLVLPFKVQIEFLKDLQRKTKSLIATELT